MDSAEQVLRAMQVIADYDALVSRALELVDGAPFHTYVPVRRHAKLIIKGAAATLVWPEDRTEYDSSYIDERKKKFPATLLFMSADEFASYKLAALEEEARASKAWREKKAAEQEQEQRQLYTALKAKFEGKA